MSMSQPGVDPDRMVSLADEEPVKQVLSTPVMATATMLDPRLPLASADDLKIPTCVDTADEAIAVVRDLHAKWQAAQAGT